MSYQPPPGQFGNAPGQFPPAKSGGSNVVKILLIIGAVLLVGFLVCCGGCYAFMQFGSSQVGNQAKSQYGSSAPVVEHIGSDPTCTLDFWASAEESQKRGGDEVLVFKVKGDKGEGVIIAGQGGGNNLTDGILRTSDGQEFDLD